MNTKNFTPSKLVEKFLLGKLSIPEENELLRWIDESSENMAFFLDEQKRLSEIVVHSDNPTDNELWQLIKKKINQKPVATKKNANQKLQLNIPMISVAASIVFGIILYVFLNSDHKPCSGDLITVQTQAGEKTNLTLPDGSIVYLNSGTTLIYPKNFEENQRVLKLSGEAFFSISHNPDKPFIVCTKDINVRVLGTEFNLTAFPDENVITTTLVRGGVRIEKEGKKGILTLADIIPYERATYYTDKNEIEVNKEVDLEQYIAWKDGKLVLMNAPIEEVAKKLELWYNVTVRIESEELKQAHFTCTFTNEPIDQVLNLLKISYPIKYSIVKLNNSGDSNNPVYDIVIKN